MSREPDFWDTLKPEYNILKIAGSSFGFKHSPKTIARMKTLHLLDDEVRKNRVLARLGKKVSNEASRAKISAAQTALIGMGVVVKNINTNEEIEYLSLTDAKALSVSRTALLRIKKHLT